MNDFLELSDFYDLVAERTAFFANRVDSYARAKGLDNQEVVLDLQLLSLHYGNEKITDIIDGFVPDELHSSRMPGIRRVKA